MTNQNNLEQLKQLSQNPLFNRAQKMAEGKSPSELEQIARNLCSQKGINYEDALSQFKQQFGF